MRLAVVASEFLPNWGGAGTYNIRLVRQLMNDADMEIHVITPRRIIHRSQAKYSTKDIEQLFNERVHVHFVCEATDTFLYNARFQLAVLRELPKLHRYYRFDIIHVDYPHMPDLLYRLKSRIPTVVTVHTLIKGHLKGIRLSGVSFCQLESSEKYQLVLSLPLLSFERLYLRRCHWVTTVSEYMKNELLKYGLDNVEVIYSGVDPDEFTPTNDSRLLPEVEVPIVLYSSRMTSAKGGQILIKAIPLVLKENDRVHFAFAGSNLSELWESLLRNERVDPKYYTFLGYLPYEQLPHLYNRASIYVCPSLYENLPARILEAMSCEVPVVASNICAIPEAIIHRKNGLLVQPGDYRGLANCIVSLLKDEHFRRSLGREARRTVVEKFNWKLLARQIKALYYRAAGE